MNHKNELMINNSHIIIFIISQDHGIGSDWNRWDNCVENPEDGSITQIQHKDCINKWSPDNEGVTCDPSIIFSETRHCSPGDTYLNGILIIFLYFLLILKK